MNDPHASPQEPAGSPEKSVESMGGETRQEIAVEHSGAGPMPPLGGLTTTTSGLQYRILRQGVGARPTPTSSVTMHYTGWTIDGTKIDSSWDRRVALSIDIRRLIKGWTEGLQLLHEKGQILLVIPPELGYSDKTAGKISPKSTLVFVVDLYTSE